MGGFRLFLVGLITAAMGVLAHAQEARVRQVSKVTMPTEVDSNSPAFWRDGRLFWFGSHGRPWLSEGPDQFGPWETREVDLQTAEARPHWMESVWPEDSNVLWGWYHTEPIGLVPDSTLTAPKIGAVVSFDGGNTLRDLGIVLESGDPLDPEAQNGYFAGGNGDFSVILDRERTYFYFLFDNYGGPASTQGVCVGRMAFADRANPDGKVWKYCNGAWQEAGRGGRVTPIFPVKKSWKAADPDAFWGPSVHWNTYLNCYVMLLNHAAGEPGWAQEGVYVSFCYDLSRPETWTEPRKILDKSQFSGWYYFYPQVMGLESGGTDRRAGQTARLYVNGTSKWEIDFIAPPAAPFALDITSSAASGAVKAGQGVTLSVTAGGSAPFTYQWLKDGVALPQATGSAYVIAAATPLDTGTYTVVISNPLGTTLSPGVALSVLAPPRPVDEPVTVVAAPEAFLSNLSVRSWLPSQHAALSLGFVVASRTPKPLALRAVGPSLSLFGVDGTANPRLEVYDANAVQTGENDDWLEADSETFAALGAFALPAGSADAALVTNIPAGPGTALVKSGGSGAVLVEIYDPAATPDSKLVNLSARALVGPGNGVLVGGFNVTGAGTKRLLIRALGPQLAAFGVPDALENPRIEVFDSSGAKIAENDDWESELAASFSTVGAPALLPGSRDAALALTAQAGQSYTVVVQSATGATGEVLLELYEAR